MGEVELRWLIAGVGIIILILIWLWGNRQQPKERLEPRADNPHSPENEPRLETESTATETGVADYRFGEFGRITPDHHLADKVLVDVEIKPVDRSTSAAGKAAAAVEKVEPESDRRESLAEHHRETEVAVPPPGTEPASLQASEPWEEETPTLILRPEEAAGPEEPVAPAAPTIEPVDERPRLTLVLTIMAPPGRPFRGPSILMAAQELRLKLHKSGVFDYFLNGQIKDKPVFGVAHLWEPGTFELDTIGKLSTPGLLIFMSLPGSMAPVPATDKMIQIARQLAQKLGGTVCNQQRERMTTQAFMKMRSAAAELEQQLGLR
ncbi:MAG: cell division protein ZipA C-terminal FtsZ-binding domain-containing protein [Candidatus Competibacteraceae bacterium]